MIFFTCDCREKIIRIERIQINTISSMTCEIYPAHHSSVDNVRFNLQPITRGNIIGRIGRVVGHGLGLA